MHCHKHIFSFPNFPPVPKDLGIGYCLNGTNGYETMCVGDSGGPAFWEDQEDSNRAYLIGIFSNFFKRKKQVCGEEPFFPGLFSRVNIAKTLNWLLPNAGKDLDDCLLEESVLKD